MAAGSDFERIFEALSRNGTRYLVVGGVAVVLHGHPRFTADLDLVLALDPDNLCAVIAALRGLGYRLRAPVALDDLLDPAIRARWIEEKGLTVLSLWSEELPVTEVDLFVAEPFPFAEAFARALRADLGGLTISVASIEDLIALKMTDLNRSAFEAQRREQIRAWLRTSYAQRLAWLEQAKRFAAKALAAASKRSLQPADSSLSPATRAEEPKASGINAIAGGRAAPARLTRPESDTCTPTAPACTERAAAWPLRA